MHRAPAPILFEILSAQLMHSCPHCLPPRARHEYEVTTKLTSEKKANTKIINSTTLVASTVEWEPM
eukprot:5733380-Amphidinium_carterae.1